MHQGEGGLPEVVIPADANRTRITGSQVYGFLKCEHSVWLDFFGDPERRRAPAPALEHLLARGRAHEAEIVETLDYCEPRYEPGDFAAGAALTLAFLREGVPGVSQGVLAAPPYLGIPDLLRRQDQPSELGEWRYVVGDIKSSWRPRADQALQVVFYSCLLGKVQGVVPEHGYLVLRDGSEERVDVAALTPVLLEVLEEMDDRLSGREASRPHHTFACRDCGWRDVCSEEPDVHWIPGLTRSSRALLDRGGFRGLEALTLVEPRTQGKKGLLPEATWQRARWGADALRTGRARPVRAPRVSELCDPVALVAVSRDGFDRRTPLWAWRPAGGKTTVMRAETAAQEEAACTNLLAALRKGGSVCHGGGLGATLYGFVDRMTERAADLVLLESRALDLMSIVRGAWVFPDPVRRPEEALSWMRGEPPELEEERNALLLEAGEWDELERVARAELDALEALLGAVREIA